MEAYDLEKSIRIEGGPRLMMLPLVRKAIKMMLHDEKGRALEYLKLANQVERLYQEVPDWFDSVLTSRFGSQPFLGLFDGDDNEDDRDRRSCGREETCDEEQVFEERYQDQHAYGRCEDRCELEKRETCDEECNLEGRDCDQHAYGHHEDHCKLKTRERCIEEGCNREEKCDEEHGLKREDREGCGHKETSNEEYWFEGKDQDTQRCNREETCDEESGLKGKDQDTQACNREETFDKERGLEETNRDPHGYDKDKDHSKLERSARDLEGYDRDKDYSKHKRRNEALHGYATLELCDGKRSWAQDSHGLNCDDEYDKFNESHKLEKKLGRDKNFTFRRNDDDDLGLDDRKGECIIDGESECHEKNEGYVDKRLCTFCGYGYDKGNDEGESDEEEFCVLGCLGFLRGRLYKCVAKSNSEIQKDIHYGNRIGISDDEDILQKYVHDDVGLHNDHKGISKENVENVIWDVYNDDVDVVSVCGKDEFRVDDIKKDAYLVINDSVIKDVANSKDDYNDNVSITNIEVVIEEDNVVVKWMVITYKEERKEMIMRTTHAKEGKDPSRWWDVQLNRGGYIANNSVSHLKENDWLIRRSTRFLHSVRQDTSTS